MTRKMTPSEFSDWYARHRFGGSISENADSDRRLPEESEDEVDVDTVKSLLGAQGYRVTVEKSSEKPVVNVTVHVTAEKTQAPGFLDHCARGLMDFVMFPILLLILGAVVALVWEFFSSAVS